MVAETHTLASAIFHKIHSKLVVRQALCDFQSAQQPKINFKNYMRIATLGYLFIEIEVSHITNQIIIIII